MRPLLAVLAAAMLAARAAARQPVAPLRVAATTPTIASLVRAVGGDDVTVTLLAHETGAAGEARESAVLAQSQLLVRNGDAAESAWLGPRLETAPRALQPDGRAHLDVSQLGSPAECSPSELLDPMRGLALAGALRDTLERLRPPRREAFTEAYETFRTRLAVAMLGDRLGTKYPLEKVADLLRLGTLDTFLAAQHESTLLGGWFGLLRSRHGVKAAADRAAWSCFAGRFGIEVVAVWEAPDHGRPSEWRKRGIALVLAGVGDRADALRTAARRARVPTVALANQVGAVSGTDDYLALIEFDVRGTARAMGGPSPGAPKQAP